MSAILLLKIIIISLITLVLILVISLAELSSQLVRYRNYWNKNNEQTPQAGELVYVALGDSAAQGVGATSPDRGYVGLIGKELKSSTGKPVRIINLSKSGAGIRHALDVQLPKYESLDLPKKHLFTIDIGANDIISFDEAKFEKEMDELMSRLPKTAIMTSIPSFQGSRLVKYEDRVLKANKIMDRLAKKHHRQLATFNNSTQQTKSLKAFAVDFFHPSNYGYKVNWLPVFMEKIKESGQI